MNPVGHQTLPIMPRGGGNLPRSQSSRGCAGQSGLGVAAGVNVGVGLAQQQQQQHSVKRAQHQHAKHFITQTTKGGFTSYTASRVNDLPEEILRDRLVQTSAHEDHRRRTIIIERDQSHGGSFGFTLQTYGIRHREVSEIELITYVDSVEPFGSAAKAGMRAGDVILSINGQDVESVDHNRLIQMIQACGKAMRVVVLFEDCVRRVALHVKLMQLKRSYQQKILEYNHYVEAERNMIETLRNKGVNTDHLVKGSNELLPLTSSTQDVLFPFRKHSRSFSRLSVSHSKSESRLISDSASNLAGSSSRRPTHHRDTSASCSTLPRLGGRRNSARSLPASAAVTPVGSLDGLEQGIISADCVSGFPIESEKTTNFPPLTTSEANPSSSADQTKISDDHHDGVEVNAVVAVANPLEGMQEVVDAINDLLDRVYRTVDQLADLEIAVPNVQFEKFSLTVEQDYPVYESVYVKRGYVYSPAKSISPHIRSSSSSTLVLQSESAGSLSLSDSGIGDRSIWSSCSTASQLSQLSFTPRAYLESPSADPDDPTADPGDDDDDDDLRSSSSSSSKLSGSSELGILFDCFCCQKLSHTDNPDPAEGGSPSQFCVMSECSSDLDMIMKRAFCLLLAATFATFALSVTGCAPVALLYACMILCLGM